MLATLRAWGHMLALGELMCGETVNAPPGVLGAVVEGYAGALEQNRLC